MFFLSHQLQDGPDLTFFFRHSILPPSIQRREKVKYLQIFFSENYLRMLMPDMTAFCRSGQWTHYRRSFPAAKATNGPHNGGLSFGFLFWWRVAAAKARGEPLRHRHRYRRRADESNFLWASWLSSWSWSFNHCWNQLVTINNYCSSSWELFEYECLSSWSSF